jgi:signal transduction histidine kinase
MPIEVPGTADAQALLDALPDGVVLAGADQRVTHVNAAARRLLGAVAAVGIPLREALPLQDLDSCGWWETLTPYGGLATRTGLAESAWLLPDGTELLVTARLDRVAPLEPVQAVAVSLRPARARARLEQERANLVTTMAHELRSPLTGVRGFTATLLERWDDFDDGQKRLIMESVHHDTDRLARLINDLLEVARISAGRLPLAASAVDPVVTAERVARSVAVGSGREVVVRAVEGTDLRLHADPDRLAQVLTNLVENAVRHGQGEVRVLLSAYDDDAVQIAVEDDGDGIAPDLRRRVFTKHWRHGDRAGTGLGMFIAHGIVRAHGGDIEVTDAASGGARIEVLWPRALDLH